METETLLPPPPAAPANPASLLEHADDYARREPVKAVASAAGVGFALSILPVGAIAGAFVVVGWKLVRPALLILGVFKALELLRVPSAPLRGKGN